MHFCVCDPLCVHQPGNLFFSHFQFRLSLFLSYSLNSGSGKHLFEKLLPLKESYRLNQQQCSFFFHFGTFPPCFNSTNSLLVLLLSSVSGPFSALIKRERATGLVCVIVFLLSVNSNHAACRPKIESPISIRQSGNLRSWNEYRKNIVKATLLSPPRDDSQ